MADGDIDVVRRLVAAFNAGDDDAVRPLLHPEVELSSVILGGTTYHGEDGLTAYRRDIDEVFENWHSEDDRFLAAGDGRVLWLYRIVGKGRHSGIAVDQPMGLVWTLSDGLLRRGIIHPDHASARRAAGLED